MLGSIPTPCSGAAFGVLDLDIARRGRVGAAADRVLVIVDERELDPERLLQRVDKGVDRAVALAFDREGRAVGLAQRRDELAIVRARRNRLLLDRASSARRRADRRWRNNAHSSGEVSSLPSASIRSWAILENSTCSERGRSRPWSARRI